MLGGGYSIGCRLFPKTFQGGLSASRNLLIGFLSACNRFGTLPIGFPSGRKLLARIIHHQRGASLGSRHHNAFASLTNTTSIRSVTENAVITTTFTIRSLSGELSRLRGFLKGKFGIIWIWNKTNSNPPRTALRRRDSIER